MLHTKLSFSALSLVQRQKHRGSNSTGFSQTDTETSAAARSIFMMLLVINTALWLPVGSAVYRHHIVNYLKDFFSYQIIKATNYHLKF